VVVDADAAFALGGRTAVELRGEARDGYAVENHGVVDAVGPVFGQVGDVHG
jgi:hypothetical protein